MSMVYLHVQDTEISERYRLNILFKNAKQYAETKS